MKKKPSRKRLNDPLAPSPTAVIGSVFRLRRDLTALIKHRVMPITDLNLEDANLLIDLYGVARLNWPDPVSRKNGFVTLSNLRASLVHSAAALSRRIASLRDAGLIDLKKVHEICEPDEKVDRKESAVAITPLGISSIAPVYDRFSDLCVKLLRDVSIADQRALYRINEELIQIAKWPY